MPSGSGEALLSSSDPAAYLPHRYPFLFLDRIIELEQGARAVALKAVTADIRGFPQFLMIECVAQLAGIIVAQGEDEGGFIASIDHAGFFSQPVVGDLLIISARVIKSFGRLFIFEGDVARGEERLLFVQLTLGVGKL